MKKDEIIKKIEQLKEPGNEEWNHQFYLPENIKTRIKDINSPGYNINKWDRLRPIIKKLNPKEKTFLDIGCSDGFYSIEIAKLGAKHVLGSDLDDLRINRAKFIKEVLKIKNVSFESLDLYKISEGKEYDVVISLFHVLSYLCVSKLFTFSDFLDLPISDLISEIFKSNSSEFPINWKSYLEVVEKFKIVFMKAKFVLHYNR